MILRVILNRRGSQELRRIAKKAGNCGNASFLHPSHARLYYYAPSDFLQSSIVSWPDSVKSQERFYDSTCYS